MAKKILTNLRQLKTSNCFLLDIKDIKLCFIWSLNIFSWNNVVLAKRLRTDKQTSV
jgi:hypothetical protein